MTEGIDLLRGLSAAHQSRREFALALAATGVGLIGVPAVFRRGFAAEGATYFTWPGYEVPELHPEYAAKYGSPPETTTFADEDGALQKLKAGFKTDIAHPCSDNVQRWRDAELLKPVDTTRLQHWPDVFPHLKELEGTHFQGEPWFVPFDWGNSSVLYRADLVDIEEDSWGLLYDERYKNRLAFLNSAEAAVEVAALVLGYDNIFTLTDDQLTEVKKLILQQRQLLRFYWQDPADIEKGLASGELVAAYGWNSSVANAESRV